MTPLTGAAGRELAEAWVKAWNAHDLDAILAHYSDDVEFTSPFVVRLLARADGIIRGKDELRPYFARALEAYPDLRFVLLEVLVCVASVTVYYQSVEGRLAAEVMCLDGAGRVNRVLAHYTD